MRPIKDAYYFSHDSNARNDEKILMLRAEHGMEGYGIYWALIEMMFESGETALRHDKSKGIALACSLDHIELERVIETCIAEDLFKTDGEFFWSESLRRRKELYQDMKEKRAAAGSKGGLSRAERKKEVSLINDEADLNDISSNAQAMLKQNSSNALANSSKGKERKGKESKGKESKEGVGGDPPSDDLKDLMSRLVITWEQNGYGSLNTTTMEKLMADAEIYSEPWVHDAIIRGNERGKRNYAYMKAILSSWQTSGKDTPRPDKKESIDSTKVLGFVEREYDTADLERRLLGRE